MAEPCPPDCDWPQQRMYLTKTLERFEQTLIRIEENQKIQDERVNNRLTKVQIAEGQMKVKSTVWGTLGGVIVGGITLAWELFKGSK